MKIFITTALLIISSIFSVKAQSSLLTAYYGIKNALVNSDAGVASLKGTEFVKAADSLKAGPLKNKLIADAKVIASSKDLSIIRENFSHLSQNFYLLVKENKQSEAPIYQMYCPMKKKYWLSNEKNIQNPYFGKAMLTCGDITETITP